MKKKLFSLILAFAMTVSMFITPINAFHVDYVTYSIDLINSIRRPAILNIEKEDGTTERINVFDENGNQLYIEVGENEWEKLDTPISAEEAARREAEEKAAKDAAEKTACAELKAKIEKNYNIKIADDFSQYSSAYEDLESQIKMIPSDLYEKVNARLGKMGKKLSVVSMLNNSSHMMSGYDGFYTHANVRIEMNPYALGPVFPHEYGHMVFMTVLPQLYSSSTVQKEWNSLAGGEGPTHVSNYAATAYSEDLAETFFALVTGICTDYGEIKSLTVDYPDCLAVKKVTYMRDLLCKVFSLDKSIFPDITPSVPSTWAKAEIEEYQSLLGGSHESVVPYPGETHPTGYQKPATRLQFVCAMHRDFIDNLWGTHIFAGMSYDRYTKTWQPKLSTGNDSYQIPFTDVTPSNVSYSGASSIYAMYSNGIMNGTSATTFSPHGQLTRQEAATILYRLCNALGYKLPKNNSNNFADSDKIAPWAKEAVDAISGAGIMNGVGNNNFDPTGVYTCEQSALTILRTYKMLIG